ncbi:homoserine kinase, partial [Helicobacter pylori]
MQRLWKKRK